MSNPKQDDTEEKNYLVDCIRLLRTNRIGPMSYFLLKARYKTCGEVIKVLEECGTVIFPKEKALEEIQFHKNIGAIILEKDMDNYPKKLQPYCKNFPIISLRGNSEILNKKSIAIVGSRQCSITGREFTKMITQKIREKYVTVSGLAIGVDSVVGENSISSGHIGVMPGGINVIYPSSSNNLHQSIINSGTSCLISFQPYNNEPKRNLFPIRNRLIAAISDAVIVTEAKLKSGSLQTADFAFSQYKKPVFVVPSHPFDQNYEGNNSLLSKPGFIPLYMNTDIEKEIKDFRNKFFGSEIFNDNDYVEVGAESINMYEANGIQLKNQILSLISLAPLSIGHINHYLNKPISQVLSTCILMEIEGSIIINPNMTIIKALDPVFLNNFED